MNRFNAMNDQGAFSPPPRKVVLWELVVGQDFRTPGGGTTFTNVEVPVPENIARILPYCEAVKAHVRVRGKSTNFGFITRFFWSLDGAEWSSAIDLHSEITTEIQTITTAYSTNSSFGILSRWAVAVRATTGTAAEGANLTIVLEFSYRT